MRPLVKAAIKASNAVSRNAQRAEIEAKAKKQKNCSIDTSASEKRKKKSVRNLRPSPSPASEHADVPKEFEKHLSSLPRRLNDITQAPPELKVFPGRVISRGRNVSRSRMEGVLSMAQKSMMEKEREKAIARYRELKAKQLEGIIDARNGDTKKAWVQ
jgi:hypothetical protein